MHGDFSKFGFRPHQRYSAVLAQQGRVQLDSEANEHALIQLHHARTLATDLIGPHGGPAGAPGFKISKIDSPNELPDLLIEGGRYYVDGILADATRPEAAAVVDPTPPTEAPLPHWTYWDQPDAFRDKENEGDKLPGIPYVVYLKVTERMVTFLQDPLVRETALGTALPDTTTRAKVTWQVLPFDGTLKDFGAWVGVQEPTARLAARTERPAKVEENPCLAAADARYRGAENQLYRVEVHEDGDDPTFKWSRENGSVTFGIASISENIVTLTDRGRDDKLDLAVGDWVEIVDDASTARGAATALLRVVDVDTERLRVELAGERTPGVGELTVRHPFLRRWDHRGPGLNDGAIPLRRNVWIDLEQGVQVWFADDGTFRTGDYWLIPARTLTADVEWPHDGQDRPQLLLPDGVRHHFAPLAVVDEVVRDVRRVFNPIAKPI